MFSFEELQKNWTPCCIPCGERSVKQTYVTFSFNYCPACKQEIMDDGFPVNYKARDSWNDSQVVLRNPTPVNPSPMLNSSSPNFRVGDYVKVTGNNKYYSGVTGTVTAIVYSKNVATISPDDYALLPFEVDVDALEKA